MRKEPAPDDVLCISDLRLLDFKEGKLSPSMSDSVSNHLLLCDACQMRLEMLPESRDEYIARVREIEADSQPVSIPNGLFQALQDLRRRSEILRDKRKFI